MLGPITTTSGKDVRVGREWAVVPRPSIFVHDGRKPPPSVSVRRRSRHAGELPSFLTLIVTTMTTTNLKPTTSHALHLHRDPFGFLADSRIHQSQTPSSLGQAAISPQRFYAPPSHSYPN